MHAFGKRSATPSGRPVRLEQSIRYHYARRVRDVHQRLVIVPPTTAPSIAGAGNWSRTGRRQRPASGTRRVRQRGGRAPCRVRRGVGLLRTGGRAELTPHRGGKPVRATSRYLRPTRLTAPDATVGALAESLISRAPAAICRPSPRIPLGPHRRGIWRDQTRSGRLIIVTEAQ